MEGHAPSWPQRNNGMLKSALHVGAHGSCALIRHIAEAALARL